MARSTEMAAASSPATTQLASTNGKKEKSSKKRKAAAVADAISDDATVAEKSTSNPEPATITPSTTKPKKEKSSKKRKASELADHVSVDTSPAEKSISNTEDVDMNNVGQPDSNPADTAENPPSKKRKSILKEEIEVDITAPEPPSKKALRRLKKGKPLPPSKSGAESTPEPESKPAKKSEVEKRSEHGIWIGNLAFHISKENLRTFFTANSEITEEMITRIHMPGPNDSKPANKVEERKKFVKVVNNKGFAYVDFSSAEAVQQAVELSEQLLSGRRILIKNNKSFEGRPEKTKEESRNDGKPPSTRVFIGNLSFDTTEDSLKEHFEKCGTIASVKVATFEDSGKCKGYAWIVFEELEGAQNAVRGFVRIEEEASDESESEDSSDEGSHAEDVSKPKSKNVKIRKWWVNKIKGRPLRMEFAEDAQVRYKKRYGKDGSKNAKTDSPNSEIEVPKAATIPVKVVEYRQPYAARLTGGIVESKEIGKYCPALPGLRGPVRPLRPETIENLFRRYNRKTGQRLAIPAGVPARAIYAPPSRWIAAKPHRAVAGFGDLSGLVVTSNEIAVALGQPIAARAGVVAEPAVVTPIVDNDGLVTRYTDNMLWALEGGKGAALDDDGRPYEYPPPPPRTW